MDSSTGRASRVHTCEQKWLLVALHMAFIEEGELDSVLSWTIGSSSLPLSPPSLTMKYGSMPKLNDLLLKVGDNSSKTQIKSIFHEFKNQILGIAQKIDKSITLEPRIHHGRPGETPNLAHAKEEEARPAKLSKIGGGGDSCGDGGIEEGSAVEVLLIDKVSTKERVFSCEQKWLILCSSTYREKTCSKVGRALS